MAETSSQFEQMFEAEVQSNENGYFGLKLSQSQNSQNLLANQNTNNNNLGASQESEARVTSGIAFLPTNLLPPLEIGQIIFLTLQNQQNSPSNRPHRSLSTATSNSAPTPTETEEDAKRRKLLEALIN